MLGEQLLTLDGVELLRVGLLGRQPGGVEAEESQAGQEQQAGRHHPDPARAGADRAADAGPEALGRGLGAAIGRPLGPEDPAPADHQQRGQQRDHHEDGDGDADGEDRAEARGGVEVGEGQAQHPDGNGRGAGEDRGRGAVQGERHRLVPVLVAAQLLAVARDEQERVVGPCADDEDAEDGLALPVDGEPGVLRQQVDQAGRDEVGRDGAQDRQQPQDRAAVGEQQDHDHHGERGEDEVGVDALERLRGVGRLAAVAGEVDLTAVDLRDVADLVGGVGDRVPPVGAEVEHEVEVGDLPVLRHQRRDGCTLGCCGLGGGRRQDALVRDAVELGDLRAVRLHRGEVVVGEPTVAVEDDQRRDVVGVDGLGELVEHLGRLGRPGQPRRRLVVLDVGQLGREAGHEAGDDEDRDEDDPLGDAAGERAGDLTMHASSRPARTDIVHR